MRRPFAVVGFTYIVTLIIASYAGLSISIAGAILCLVSSICVFFGLKELKYRKAVTAVFCTAAAAFGVFCLFEAVKYNPVASLSGKTAEISGAVCEEPESAYGRYYYIINADKITLDGKASNIKTKIRLISYSDIKADAFDRVSTKVKLKTPDETSASGYNSRAYYKSKGIYLTASAANAKVVVSKESHKPLYYYAIKTRRYISSAIDKYVWGERGALAAGILIGDTSGLSEEVKNSFTDTGISHILAVSGTQTSLIMQYFLLLLCFLKVPKRVGAGITAAAIAFFMAITGFSPSVMRAGIMALVFLAAIIIQRNADTINSLGFSALLLCLANPYAANDVGLLLSLAATLGMVILSPKIISFFKTHTEKLPEKAKRPLKPLYGVLCETIGASVFTFPIIIFVFGKVSLVSLLSNIVEVPVALIVTLITAVLAILSPLSFLAFLLKPLALIIRLLCAFMICFAGLLDSIPFANISADYMFVDIITVFAVAVLALYLVFRKKGANAAVCISCVCFALVTAVFSYNVASHGVMTVASLSGDGSAVVLSNGHAVLCDVSEDKTYPATVKHFLKTRNIKAIDAVILTKYSSKKMLTLSNIEKDFDVQRVYVPQNSDIKEATSKVPLSRVKTACYLHAPYGVTIKILPDSEKDEQITQVSANKATAVVTGNSMSGDYKEYNPAALKSNLLIFADNPDKSFLSAVSPIFASGGEKSSADTLSELVSLGANVDSGSRLYLSRSESQYKVVTYK